MTDPFVLRLDDAGAKQASRVGGKAAALSALLQAGFPVPPSVCVTADAFQFVLAELKAPIDAILRRHAPLSATSAQAAAEEIARLLADLAVPSTVATPLRASLLAIGVDFSVDASPLAIRSSATDEDGLDASFAGCYRSVVGARGEDAVHGALVACWRSFYEVNALLARAARRDATAFSGASGGASGGMAVVIQPMIEAECAGVCFSVDPVRQRRDQVVVNAAWGLGAGVVDGSVATDTARINRKDLSIAEHQIAVKDEHIILDPNPGQALRRAATPAERQRAACLPDSWLSRIAQFGIAAELLFERPQDMEWAVAADRVWVLQSRPHPTSTLARRRQGRLRRMRERPPTGCSMRGRPR